MLGLIAPSAVSTTATTGAGMPPSAILAVVSLRGMMMFETLFTTAHAVTRQPPGKPPQPATSSADAPSQPPPRIERRRLGAQQPVLEEATPEGRAPKKTRLDTATKVVTQELVLDTPPPAPPPPTQPTAPTKRDLLATAAETRKRSLEQRGIGNLQKVRKMAHTSAANAERAAATTPAAHRAERLRQALLKRSGSLATLPGRATPPRARGAPVRGLPRLRVPSKKAAGHRAKKRRRVVLEEHPPAADL